MEGLDKRRDEFQSMDQRNKYSVTDALAEFLLETECHSTMDEIEGRKGSSR
jgi:hypothetical protein